MATQDRDLGGLRDKLSGLPGTETLYYRDPYAKDFDAEVLRVVVSEGRRYIVLNRTCFFPEGGGQPGDRGSLTGPSGELKVVDARAVDDIILHISDAMGSGPEAGGMVRGRIDWEVRYERMRQHTGSHVLFSAIKKVLGMEELRYMGVQIGEDASRIDISYGKPIPPNQLLDIEALSNRVCLENRRVEAWPTTRDEAERKYGKQLGLTEVTPSGAVRAVEVEGWDIALCCGTHVRSTAEIGLIKILGRYRLQKGVERIEFTAGKSAYENYRKDVRILTELARTLSCSKGEIPDRVKAQLDEKDRLRRELEMVKERLVEAQALNLLREAEPLDGFRLLQKRLSEVDAQTLKAMASSLAAKDPYLVAILGAEDADKAILVGAAGDKILERGINMAEMINEAASAIQGGGGGTPKLAQAGGKEIRRLDEAIKKYAEKLSTKLHVK